MTIKKNKKNVVLDKKRAQDTQTEETQFAQFLDLFKGKRIVVATPCYGGNISSLYFDSMLALTQICTKYDIDFTVITIKNESLITRARNTIVSLFLKNPKNTHLFFIDADIFFQPFDVLKLVSCDKDVLLGAYPKKTLDWKKAASEIQHKENVSDVILEELCCDYVVNFLMDKNKKKLKIIDNQFFELKEGGTGFMCIKREVIEKMIESYPNLKYKNLLNIEGIDEHYALFDTMIEPETGIYLSEDYTFCRYWRELGGAVLLDPSISLNHIGSYSFKGNLKGFLNDTKK